VDTAASGQDASVCAPNARPNFRPEPSYLGIDPAASRRWRPRVVQLRAGVATTMAPPNASPGSSGGLRQELGPGLGYGLDRQICPGSERYLIRMRVCVRTCASNDPEVVISDVPARPEPRPSHRPWLTFVLLRDRLARLRAARQSTTTISFSVPSGFCPTGVSVSFRVWVVAEPTEDPNPSTVHPILPFASLLTAA
jgi:hypothetical protein